MIEVLGFRIRVFFSFVVRFLGVRIFFRGRYFDGFRRSSVSRVLVFIAEMVIVAEEKRFLLFDFFFFKFS